MNIFNGDLPLSNIYQSITENPVVTDKFRALQFVAEILQNDSTRIFFRLLFQQEKGGDFFPLPYESKKINNAMVSISEKEIVDFFTLDAKTYAIFNMKVPDEAKSIKIEVISKDVGVTAGILKNLWITKSLKGGVVGDEIQKEIVTRRIEQQAVCDEEHYTCQDYDSAVSSPATKYWHIKTPDSLKRIIFTNRLIASKQGLWELFEEPDLSSDGTPLTIFNNDRNSSNTSTVLCFKDPGINSDGVRIPVNVVGSDSTAAVGGSGGMTGAEIVGLKLKQNTSYLVKYTPQLTNTRVSNCFEWYEKFD